jgi:hypothetical protein
MSIRRISSSLAALVLVGGMLAAVAVAGSASADEVWYQSAGRASAEVPCPVSTGTELEAGWSQWGPSWAQWSNQGRGGFVCDRQITWAITPTPAWPGCQFADDQRYNSDPYESTYLQFGSRVFIPAAELNGFDNPDCSGVPFGAGGEDAVFASSQVQAQSLCPVGTVAALGEVETITTDSGPLSIINPSPNIYYCIAPPG